VKKILLFIFSFILLTSLFWYFKYGRHDKLERYFGELPGANEVKTSSVGDVWTLSYWATLSYPADPAIQFYESKMTARGWNPVLVSSLGIQRKWVSFRRNGGPTDPLVCTYNYQAIWVDASKKRMTRIALDYLVTMTGTQCEPEPSNNVLFISIQEMPFLNT
jgi:hypothetical protein